METDSKIQVTRTTIPSSRNAWAKPRLDFSKIPQLIEMAYVKQWLTKRFPLVRNRKKVHFKAAAEHLLYQGRNEQCCYMRSCTTLLKHLALQGSYKG